MTSLRLSIEQINQILRGRIIERTGGPTIKVWADKELVGLVSDGYHTFNELYEHRIVLFIALCKKMHETRTVWRTEFHSDGSRIEGWFLLGINTQMGEQITYHLPMRMWDECRFASKCDRAPAFDGHTSADVLERISKL